MGIPTPPGFAPPALDDLGVVDRPTVALRVAGEIACGWIERYELSRTTGDPEGADEAMAALAGTHDWPVLVDLARDGRPPIVFWRAADEIVRTGDVGPRNGSDGEGWATTFGCTG